MKFAAIIVLLAVIAGCTGANTAESSGRLVSVAVVTQCCDVKMAYKGGNTFFAAPIGEEYTIVVKNRTNKRILVVPTVDGLNVIDRSKGNWDGSGYVLDAYEKVEIPGFRRSDDFQYVERFTFSEARFSLANRIGNVRNVGVIGVAVFEEYVPPPEPVYSYGLSAESMDAKEEAGARGKSAAHARRAGTEAGRTVRDPVRRVNFQRASDMPAEILAMYYDTEENLISAGILPPTYNPPPIGFLSPFPSNYIRGTYVTD
ncbi:hypothetical protein DRQ36_01165 [bacterium]|nr:MAG: hypothetical protein DRQ36_01165 [bacterium]